MSRSVTQKEFIKRANTKHNNFYDYGKVVYKRMVDKIIIICPIHGEFLQAPSNHLNGQGCIECGYLKTKYKQKKIIHISKIEKK